MIFNGRNRIRYNYARFGWTRGGGKTWHGGMDIEGLDDKTIHAAAGGKVAFAGVIASKSNRTWEWGWYVKIATSDGRWCDYYCHCERLLVKAGQVVKAGAAIAIMGNSGNAAQASPPYAHVHYERRKAGSTSGTNPSTAAGIPNTVGTYGTAPAQGGGDTHILDTAKPMQLRITAKNCEYFAARDVANPLGKLALDTVYDVAEYYLEDVFAGAQRGHWVRFAFAAGDAAYCLVLPDRATVTNVADTPAKVHTVQVITDKLNVRSAPGTAHLSIGAVARGDKLAIAEQANGWGFVLGKGWVSLEYTKAV